MNAAAQSPHMKMLDLITSAPLEHLQATLNIQTAIMQNRFDDAITDLISLARKEYGSDWAMSAVGLADWCFSQIKVTTPYLQKSFVAALLHIKGLALGMGATDVNMATMIACNDIDSGLSASNAISDGYGTLQMFAKNGAGSFRLGACYGHH